MVYGQDAEDIKNFIDTVFMLADGRTWNGTVNDDVVIVAADMLEEIQQCNRKMKWIPPHPGRRANEYSLDSKSCQKRCFR
ncbi:MAG TPA: hypothetical protein ENI94_01065 [Gammaproteobacteria bacterium]|nr:hypothetical protein [Gammaproteobacteria bacterium]